VRRSSGGEILPLGKGKHAVFEKDGRAKAAGFLPVRRGTLFFLFPGAVSVGAEPLFARKG